MGFNDTPVAGTLCRLSQNGDEYDGILVRTILTRDREATIEAMSYEDVPLISRFVDEYGRENEGWVGSTHLDPIPALEQLAMEAE